MIENTNPIIERCELFAEMQVWPIEPPINPELWLSNFNDDEMPYAESLLSSFFYYNEKMCNTMLETAFKSISLYFPECSIEEKIQKWQELCENAIFTTVDIDENNPTASGNLICRRARQVLGIPEERFFKKEDALKRLYDGTNKTIIFLDDFIGSGLQFTDTWTDPFIDRGNTYAYPDICARDDTQAFYVTLIATEYGIGEIYKTCRNVEIVAANTLGRQYNALNDDSIIWPDDLKEGANDFLKAVGERAGMKNYEGFHKLGLTVAFHHSVPDATLPIFYWNENGWHPLIERR
jgi:hypothetical protein